jgi:hypothetical protein
VAHIHLSGSLVALAIATAGCRHNSPSLGARPSPAHAQCDSKAAWDIVVAYAGPGWPSMRLAMVVPEFGGAYVDTVLKVYVTDLSARDRLREAIDRYNSYGRRGREVRFIQGTYSYRDLRAWGQCILPYTPRGVASYEVSERDNRNKFTVVTDAARQDLETVISRLDLPRAAFIIERGEYAKVT